MNQYTVEINGIERTVQLDEDDAKRLGAKAKSEPQKKAAKAPANKARSAKNKS